MKKEIQQNLIDREKDICTKTLQKKNLEAKLRLEEKDGKTLQCELCGEQVSFFCEEQILAVISDERELICGECAGLPECYGCENFIGEDEDYTTIEVFDSPFDEESKKSIYTKTAYPYYSIPDGQISVTLNVIFVKELYASKAP